MVVRAVEAVGFTAGVEDSRIQGFKELYYLTMETLTQGHFSCLSLDKNKHIKHNNNNNCRSWLSKHKKKHHRKETKLRLGSTLRNGKNDVFAFQGFSMFGSITLMVLVDGFLQGLF